MCDVLGRRTLHGHLGQVVQLLAYAENIQIRPTLTTNSLAALRHFVKRNNGVTLIGAFAAYRELEAGEIVALPIAHPLFEAAKARLLVKGGRPLAVAADTLLRCILRDMPMFADWGTAQGKDASTQQASNKLKLRAFLRIFGESPQAIRFLSR
jgi:DNA-binding transcriptional LysR family regulator